MVSAIKKELGSNGRITRLRDKVLEPPQLCVERGYLVTESYKETESEPYVIRNAKALAKVLEGLSIFIDDDELIVGRTTSKQRGGLLMPEIQWECWLEGMDNISNRDWDRCLPLSKEEKAKMSEFLPYWKGKTVYEKYLAQVPEYAKKLNDAIQAKNTGSVAGGRGGHSAIDFERVLTKGLNGIKKEVEDELRKLDLVKRDDFKKYQFLTAVNITLDAALDFAMRYSKLAADMADKEKDTVRKAELMKISETCAWVPANPARSFYEALQSIWLVYVVLRNEGLGPGISLARPDQYLYPFYKKDIEQKLLTMEEARELLEMLLIKLNDAVVIMSSEYVEQLAGFPTLANITVGGITREGEDAVNELSYLLLEAELDVKLTVEEFVIRVNKKNPESFLMEACEVARELRGKFKFISDETAIKQLVSEGRPIEYARDYVLVGCFSPTIPSYSFDAGVSMINLPMMLELALNNGASRLTGEQIGPETGDPREFKSYEDVWNAYKIQTEAMMPVVCLLTSLDMQLFADYVSCPFQSAFYHGCIENGRDLGNEGATLPSSRAQGLVGAPNVGDSLAAIKKTVFEDNKISMGRLIDALDKNFEGEQEVLHILKSAPKFGNDDDYVDSIVNEAITHACDTANKYETFNGIRYNLSASAGTGYIGLGKLTGALPDGRMASEPLSEGGISPYQGRNISGATATLNSVAKLDHMKMTGGSVLNMRFNPDLLKDETKMSKFASLIRTYCETGGYHVQFNIIDSDTLKDAQIHPENYRDLLVRVATYSAYFVELSPRLQNEIISRMEFQGF